MRKTILTIAGSTRISVAAVQFAAASGHYQARCEVRVVGLPPQRRHFGLPAT